MFETIKDLGLKPARPYTRRAKTDRIILHHFAGSASVEAVHSQHIAKGNKGIDYNVVVCLDGQAVYGRGLEFEGGHVKNSGRTAGMNQSSIGVACQGNFETGEMAEGQKQALLRLVEDLLAAYPTIKSIVGHKEVDATACHGQYFPLSEVKALLDRPVAPTPPEQRNLKLISPMMRGEDVTALQSRLKALGYAPGAIDGIFGPKTRAAVLAFQRARKLQVDGICGPKTRAALGI